MARMMPPYCPESAPPGELDLFAALASSPETDGWIVLHSLALASHVRQVQGEADFAIIVPQRGVLVVEVKSHLTAQTLADGRWKLGAGKPTSRSPFQQANEAKYSIREYLDSRHFDLRDIPTVDAVWFTSFRARATLPASPEWHPWQLLDSEDLRRGAATAILRVLDSGRRHLATRIARFDRDDVGPDDQEATRMAALLRPKFEAAVVPGDIRRARKAQLVSFLDEQYDALDSMEQNKAVLFTGPAGSGKTWLAIERARRHAERGRSGRLLCFNRMLSEHLKAQLTGIPEVRVATFHEELVRVARVTPPPAPTPSFWEEELPDMALEALLADSGDRMRDFLVVDEVQDLSHGPYLDALDLMVEGGLADGRVALFGDFERQALYEVGDHRQRLHDRISGLASFKLTANCRNLPRIGTVVNKLTRLVPGYRRFRRPDDGIDPEFIPVDRGQDQSSLLVDAVQTLRDQGYGLDEIVVLSPHRMQSTATRTGHSWLRQILRPAEGGARGGSQGLLFTTVHAFKGLESPAVILTDLDETQIPNFEALLYTGMTRATDRLVALIEPQTLRHAFGGSR